MRTAILIVLLVGLFGPVALAVIYTKLWPRVHRDAGTVGWVGALLGVAFSVAAMFWALLPLATVGLSGGAGDGAAELELLLQKRFIFGLSLATGACWISMLLVDRRLSRRKEPA